MTAETPSPTFADAWELWLAHRTHGARPLRASTLADYGSIYSRHLAPALTATPIDEIDGVTITRLTVALARSGLSSKRVSNVLVPLRACLRWHHRIGTLPRNPGPFFDASVIAADERIILSPGEIERLLAELEADAAAFVAFAAYVGTRAGEQRALTWGDIDLDAGIARVDKTYYRTQLQHGTKTGAGRIVPLPPHIVATLRERLAARQPPPAPSALVFPGPSGGPLCLDDFRARTFRPAVVRAGLNPNLRIHDLRHTSASLYLQSGATVREVMAIHGWNQMQTAMRYLHNGDTLGAAAARLSETRAQILAEG
jgi:integrase